jgi:hypothetical protein
VTAEQAENAAELVAFFLHDDREQDDAVGHDAGFYRRPDGSCSYCEGVHPVEAPAA